VQKRDELDTALSIWSQQVQHSSEEDLDSADPLPEADDDDDGLDTCNAEVPYSDMTGTELEASSGGCCCRLRTSLGMMVERQMSKGEARPYSESVCDCCAPRD